MSLPTSRKEELLAFISEHREDLKHTQKHVVEQLKTQSDEEVMDGYLNPGFFGREVYEQELNSRGIYM